jgi:hypothetical protein
MGRERTAVELIAVEERRGWRIVSTKAAIQGHNRRRPPIDRRVRGTRFP